MKWLNLNQKNEEFKLDTAIKGGINKVTNENGFHIPPIFFYVCSFSF